MLVYQLGGWTHEKPGWVAVCKDREGTPMRFYHMNHNPPPSPPFTGGWWEECTLQHFTHVFFNEWQVFRWMLKTAPLGETIQDKFSKCFTSPLPSTLTSFMWWNLPGLPSLFLHTASDHKLGTGGQEWPGSKANNMLTTLASRWNKEKFRCYEAQG